MASTIRSFIAVELTPEHRRSVERVIRKMSEKWPEYRWSDRNQLHVTVNFLGEVPDESVPRVCEIMRETLAKHEPFSFQLGNLGAFPKPARPRILWLGIEEGKSQLSRLHYDIADALVDLRLDRDRKGFRPHVTLARIKSTERWPDSMVQELENNQSEEGSSANSLDLGFVDVQELVLYSSHMEKGGPVYTPMDRVSLG